MTIALKASSAMGLRDFSPEGPFGTVSNFPISPHSFGDTIDGDKGARYVYVRYAPVAAVTANQGDVFVFDGSFTAERATLGAAYHPMGAWAGTLFLGARVADKSLNPAPSWSFAFAPGVYGIWLQVRGCSLIHAASQNAQTKPASTTATAGEVDFPATAAVGSETIAGMFSALLTGTITANTTAGSATLTSVSSNKDLAVGMTLSGTGIPNGSTITDIQGSSMTISQAATATGAGVTVTWNLGTFFGTTTNGTYTITSTQEGLPGVYPNQTLTGTGLGASAVVTEIDGTPGNWTITASVASTASGTVSIAASGYYEAMLNDPYISAQN